MYTTTAKNENNTIQCKKKTANALRDDVMQSAVVAMVMSWSGWEVFEGSEVHVTQHAEPKVLASRRSILHVRWVGYQTKHGPNTTKNDHKHKNQTHWQHWEGVIGWRGWGL